MFRNISEVFSFVNNDNNIYLYHWKELHSNDQIRWRAWRISPTVFKCSQQRPNSSRVRDRNEKLSQIYSGLKIVLIDINENLAQIYSGLKIVLIDINENLSQISSGLEIAPIDINENLSRVHSGSEMLTINFNKKLSKIHSYLEIFDFRFQFFNLNFTIQII